MGNYLNINQDVVNHQIELAEKAVAGDMAALKTIANNFGYFGGSGTGYWPDLDRALAKAHRIVETQGI